MLTIPQRITSVLERINSVSGPACLIYYARKRNDGLSEISHWAFSTRQDEANAIILEKIASGHNFEFFIHDAEGLAWIEANREEIEKSLVSCFVTELRKEGVPV